MSDSKTTDVNTDHLRHLAEEARQEAARLDRIADQVEAGEPLGPAPDLPPEMDGITRVLAGPDEAAATPGQVQVGTVREPEPAEVQGSPAPLGVRWDHRLSRSARVKLLEVEGQDPDLAASSWDGLPGRVRRALLDRWA